MPWRNPDNWLNAEIMAPVLSFILALFRAVYQGSESSWTRRFTESAICGMITLSAGYLINAMGWHGDLKFAAAGAIGFLGVDYIRTIAHKFLNKKVSGK